MGNYMKGGWVPAVLSLAGALVYPYVTRAADVISLGEALRLVESAPIIDDVAISPNHRLVAWTEEVHADASPSSPGSVIYLQEAKSGAPRLRISAASGRPNSQEKREAWSPGSDALAFLSDAESPGQLQLYVKPVGSGGLRQLTQLKGYLDAPKWSPDGRSIAILYTQDAVRASGPLEAVTLETGVIGAHVYEQRLAIVDVASGAVSVVTPADLYVYEFDWAPDAQHLVLTAAYGAGDANWYAAELMIVGREAATPRVLLQPKMQIAVPRWSPDGRSIAFIGGLMSDESVAAGDIYVIDASGGAPRNCTVALDGSAYWVDWRSDARHLLFADAVDGGSGVGEVDTVARTVHRLWKGAETLRGPAAYARGVSFAADERTTAVVRETFSSAPRVWIGPIGHWKPLAPEPSPSALWGAAENIRWTSDQFRVQGWLIPPRNMDPRKRYPLVVWVHGGPAWLSAPAWPPSFEGMPVTLLATQGYYIFCPNPRGSAGFGESFKRANVRDLGGGDLRDILSGVQQVIATHPIDDTQVGIAGWSYGGYMAMWALTQTERFRAAVIGAGISNWQSYYGENGIDGFMIPYFGASVYDDPSVYAKSSPINFIKTVRTPTLLVVGEGDIECPPPQSYEYWHALRSLGIKSELVVYPREGHQFTNPENLHDVIARAASWLNENLMKEAHSATQ